MITVKYTKRSSKSENVGGLAAVDYEVGKWSYAPYWLAKSGYHLLSYSKKALYVDHYASASRRKFVCEAVGQIELPQFCNLSDLRAGKIVPDSKWSWPANTVMHVALKPLFEWDEPMASRDLYNEYVYKVVTRLNSGKLVSMISSSTIYNPVGYSDGDGNPVMAYAPDPVYGLTAFSNLLDAKRHFGGSERQVWKAIAFEVRKEYLPKRKDRIFVEPPRWPSGTLMASQMRLIERVM